MQWEVVNTTYVRCCHLNVAYSLLRTYFSYVGWVSFKAQHMYSTAHEPVPPLFTLPTIMLCARLEFLENCNVINPSSPFSTLLTTVILCGIWLYSITQCLTLVRFFAVKAKITFVHSDHSGSWKFSLTLFLPTPTSAEAGLALAGIGWDGDMVSVPGTGPRCEPPGDAKPGVAMVGTVTWFLPLGQGPYVNLHMVRWLLCM